MDLKTSFYKTNSFKVLIYEHVYTSILFLL